MKETKRIASLFEKLYEGSPWIDVNIKDTLSSLNAKKAAKKVSPGANSIWEIVNHLIAWRQNVLQRVNGKVIITPASNYFEAIEDIGEANWQHTLGIFEQTQKDWLQFLKSFSAGEFENIYPNNGMTYYEHIHGIIQHDAYHLGQVRILINLL